MGLSLSNAAQLLDEHHLLREVIAGDVWTMDAAKIAGHDANFTHVTYDTRTVESGTLLFCKGRFDPAYLDGSDERGLAAYVAERNLSAHTTAPGLIVNDVRRAMCLLSSAFYDRPQDALTVIGVTGTKGKTTTGYFTQAILNAFSGGKCALFSSVDNCLDGHTYVESDLTTPESLDAFRMMATARDNGMRYLVMEVSSQAYKVERVYGLTFDVGAFLNISPDHISPTEHPTFEDYLYCKRQIVANSRRLVLGADSDHADLIRDDARRANVPVLTFSRQHADGALTPADTTAVPADAAHATYRITSQGTDLHDYRLSIPGDFNYDNAAAAVSIAVAAGVPLDHDNDLHALQSVTVPGRMEEFADPLPQTTAIVDYAHNRASVNALLDYVTRRFGDRHPRITLVTGSAGNKAYDRRDEIVQAAQDRINSFIFTAEDTDTEPFIDICMQMQHAVSNPAVSSTVISDRTAAVTNAIYDARAHADRCNVILIIGKGNERWIKNHHDHIPYEGDDRIVQRVFTVHS